MTSRRSVPVSVLLLLAVAGALIAAGVIEVGPRTASARTETQVITAERGVVQSTVTGTGNVEPAVDDTVNFKASGILQDVFVHVGQHVREGQLMATLNPSSAKLALAQAKENLTAAEDQLTSAQDASYTRTAAQAAADATEFVDYRPGDTASGTSADVSDATGTSAAAQAPTQTVTQTVTVTTPAPTPPTRTVTVTVPETSATRVPTPTHTVTVTTPTPAPTVTVTTPASTTTPSSGYSHTGSTAQTGTGSTGSGSTTSSAGAGSSGTVSSGTGSSATIGTGTGSLRSSGGSGTSGTSGSSANSATSATDKAASIAQAQASVDSAQASVTSAEQALADTNLYAPADGTVVSMETVSPGDSISAGGTGNSSASGSSGSGSSSSTAAGGLGNFSSTSSSTSSTSSAFAEIVDSKQLTMTVPFSESDITKVKVGQTATVTLDALAGVELGAHVTSISTIGTTSSSVVSYNATITLDQNNSQVRPGMSASVAVTIGQAGGVTLPNDAVSGTGSTGTVQLLKNGKPVTQQVVVGLRGDSRTQIISGLSAGQQVSVTTTLPSLGASSSSSSSGSGTLGGGSGFGGAGGFGGAAGSRGFGGAGAGGGAFLRRALGG